MCGKEAKYNPEWIATANGGDGSTDYIDMQLSAETIGRTLCKDCLKKHAEDIISWTMEKNTRT